MGKRLYLYEFLFVNLAIYHQPHCYNQPYYSLEHTRIVGHTSLEKKKDRLILSCLLIGQQQSGVDSGYLASRCRSKCLNYVNCIS